MNRVYIALLAGLLATAPSLAETDTETDAVGRKLVDEFLTDVITLQGDFVQVLFDANGDEVDRTSGTLEIEKPGRFRWSYEDPYEQWLIADGDNIWSYDLDLEQVTVKPQTEALANTPALLLGGSQEALQQFDFGGTTIERVTTWVRLDPKDKSSGFERVELGFMDNELRRMLFIDNLDQRTFVALNDVAINEPIDGERFTFVVPEGVDLVGKPAASSTESP